jgi:hypothetical protein
VDIPLLSGSLARRLAAVSRQPSTLLTEDRVRVTLWLAVCRKSVCVGQKSLRNHDQYFFFQLNTCGHSPYVTSSIIAAGSRQRSLSQVRVPTTFYCLRCKTLPTWRATSPYLYPPGTGWPVYFQQYLQCCVRIRCCGNVFTEPLPTNGSTRYITMSTGDLVEHTHTHRDFLPLSLAIQGVT